MAVIFVADVHAGNHRRHGGAEAAGVNERCAEIVDVLRDAVGKAREGDTVVVLGDLFDSCRPSPQVIAHVAEALDSVRLYQTRLLVGNHDRRSDAPGDHALAPFVFYDAMDVVEAPTRLVIDPGVDLLCVPYLAGQTADSIEDAVRALAAGVEDTHPPCSRAICLHAGLIYPGAPPWAQTARSAISVQRVRELAAEVGADLVVSGDWHTHRAFTGGSLPPAYQCGALVPTGWDNPGLDGYGTVIAWDPYEEGPPAITHLPGPRFLRASADKARDVIRAAVDAGHSPRVRVDAIDAEEAAKAGAILGVVEVHRADVDPKQAAQQAARAARSSKTIDEAIAAYCREMPLPNNVDHTVVADAVRRYVAGATDEG